MKNKNVVGLLEFGVQTRESQEWADLGCGTGVFTIALANLLAPGSLINAVDKRNDVLVNIPDKHLNVRIRKWCLEFRNDDMLLQDLDGILMANSLHFVRDKKSFLSTMKPKLKSGGTFLIVEYDRKLGSPWVPYPITPLKAEKIFIKSGFTRIQKLHQVQSRYGGKIYSMVARV